MSPGQVVLLAAAGLVAGAVNTAAGGGSLLTFPVLVATGHSALSANISNTLGITPGNFAGALAYREEIARVRRRSGRLAIDASIGAVIGTVLLLVAPPGAFRDVVPALLVVASVLLLLQSRIAARLAERTAAGEHALPRPVHAAVLIGSIYGGYFGAALGVMLLALLGLVLPDDLQQVNGLKTMLQFVTNAVAAVGLGIFGPVDWVAVLVLAIASPVGGYSGAAIARRVPAQALRVAVAAIGIAAAVVLLLS
ncbi:MAG TPA: sulfite exporter TauE/SafE family protein [Mycobacteriales bacterium]|nr:sulfite exporter TauE/SafE family protein [Mycobacteriales bacterium]